MLEQKMIQRKKGIKFEFKSNLKGTEWLAEGYEFVETNQKKIKQSTKTSTIPKHESAFADP